MADQIDAETNHTQLKETRSSVRNYISAWRHGSSTAEEALRLIEERIITSYRTSGGAVSETLILQMLDAKGLAD